MASSAPAFAEGPARAGGGVGLALESGLDGTGERRTTLSPNLVLHGSAGTGEIDGLGWAAVGALDLRLSGRPNTAGMSEFGSADLAFSATLFGAVGSVCGPGVGVSPFPIQMDAGASGTRGAFGTMGFKLSAGGVCASEEFVAALVAFHQADVGADDRPVQGFEGLLSAGPVYGKAAVSWQKGESGGENREIALTGRFVHAGLFGGVDLKYLRESPTEESETNDAVLVGAAVGIGF